MDRLNKNRTGKPSKSHHPFPGSGELIALGKGNKSNLTSTTEEVRKPSTSSKLSSSKSVSSSKTGGSLSSGTSSSSKSGERKREVGTNSSSSHSNPHKKIRLQSNLGPGPNFLSATVPTTSSKVAYSSQQPKPIKKREHSTEEFGEIDTNDLSGDKFVKGIDNARKANDVDRAQALLLAGIKRLRLGKDKPDVTLCLGLLRGSKVFGNLLRNSSTLEAVCSLVTMKRSGVDLKTKLLQQSPSLFSSLAVSMISNSHDDVQSAWPLIFVQMWVEDACSDRSWVDNAQCKPFVDNLICSFNTKIPPSNLIPSDHGPPGSSSPSLIQGGDSDAVFLKDLTDILEENMGEMTPRMRYNGMEDKIEECILEFTREIISRKAPDVPRNVLRTLGSACGLSGIRAFVVSKLEQWVHNAKSGRQAQELLLYLCVNSHCNTTADSEIVLQIAKMRIKTKPLASLFSIAIKEMVRDSEPNLRRVLTQIVHNELSPTRNTNNFTLFASIMSSCPEGPSVLADVFVDLLQKREDFLGALRLLLREIVRASRYEFDLVLFVRGFLKTKESHWREADIRERGFKAIVELIVISMFLVLSPSVKEAAASKKDSGVITGFQRVFSKIQEEALIWMYSIAPTTFRPAKKDFTINFNKVIIKDAGNELQSKDGWPSESDKSLFARLCVETPIEEESLMWMFFQGLTKEHNIIPPSELLDIVELVIMRSATHSGVLLLKKMEIIEFLFRLTEYNYPEAINLPTGYEPPKLAISKPYWRVWILLTVISAFNTSTFGKVGWGSYPTLKVLMEMCMTNHFSFPTLASSNPADDVIGKERQVAALEKEQILEFETHLAASSNPSKGPMNERTSLLISQLMRLDPLGLARAPPSDVLSQLQLLNDQLHLGHRLCKSRSPDFLVNLIQRNSQPMPWLSELVSEGSFEILPVQCLCEFMLGQTERIVKAMNFDLKNSGESEPGTEKPHKKGVKTAPELIKEDVKGMQLLHYLKDVVHGSQEGLSREVLEYFFRRLSSKKMQSRMQALQGIQLLLSSPKKPLDENWLLDSIPTLRSFSDVQPAITTFLRSAIQVENEPKWIAHYLEFLSTWSNVDSESSDIQGLALDVAQLVVERNGVVSSLIFCEPKSFDSLFDMFLNYIKKIREPHQEAHKWSENAEQVLVQWPDEGLEASLNILIIHAIVILLTSYATNLNAHQGKQQHEKKKSLKGTTDLKYSELLDIWFPRDKLNTPKGFLLNTSEEAILYPDWIKLRMIRSNNSRLLAAALHELEVEQLVLFVQSFGIPIQSMTALLYCVDTSVENTPEKVSSVVLDPQYMNTLVELQWKRGASGGEKFARLLKSRISEPNQTVFKRSIPKSRTRPTLNISVSAAGSTDVEVMDFTTKLDEGHQTKANISRYIFVRPENSTQEPDASGDQNIRSLSKQLLTAASSASSSFRRRSVPILDDSASLIPRRHSSYLEQISEKTKKGGYPANTVGQLVDRFRDVEPCIVRNALDIQLPLLFGRNETPPPCRSFLLTVLTHESGWDTVEQCLTLFLREFDPSYDPSTILDLISSTIKNPKLWQGCDKYVPKHQPLQSIFHLSPSQLLVMAEYIVEEISQLEVKNTKFSISNLLGTVENAPSKNGKKMKHCLQQRVSQWLLCCNSSKEVVDTVISTLIEKKGRNPCTRKLISQVYLGFPEVILMKNWKSEDVAGSEDDVSCILDTVSHILITTAANVQSGKEWYRKITNECEICLRKIASVHPILLLRQLPLMGALLEGRVHLEFAVFHVQNHQVPFQVFLGLIDLMQPHVLKHFKILKNIFTLYIKLFTNFGQQRDYSATLGRFSVLLHNLLATYPTEMKEFLSLHYPTLKELVAVKYYADVGPFQNLMTSIVPPSAGTDELLLLTPNSSEMDPFSMSSVPATAIFDRIQNANNHDEILPVLQELDSLSTRNPAVLHKFSEILIPLVMSENDNCRNLAFTLILKHVTYCPTVNTIYLEIILQVLQTSSSHLKDTLLDRIHEFVVLAQENAQVVLKQMFDLGISSNVNILPTISKSLALLRSQSGSS